MTDFSEDTQANKVTAADAAVTTSGQVAPESDFASEEVVSGHEAAILELEASAIELEAAEAAALTPVFEEDVVISSFLVSTFKDQTDEASETISKIAGVEVHEVHDTTLVITIEAPTIDESTRVATEVNLSKGVVSMRMIYANFEDDPVIKAHMKAYLEKQAQDGK